MFELTVDIQGLDEVKRMLQGIPGRLRPAVVRALNDTAKQTRTALSKSVRDRVKIKKKDLDPYFTIKLAHPTSTPSAVIRIKKSARIPLRDFGARQAKSGKGGVTYQIAKTGGRKRIKDAFIVESMGGHVFRRKGKARFPVSKLQGVSAWGVVRVNKMDEQAVRDGQALLRRNLMRSVKYELLRAEGKAR